ncbi:MAG: endonuclease/exonuclease/phosphatase family protein [Rubritepida sp.]|jgi:endonuclease/exonuclease/phosphatase family metal-dependent hydrolase|nr:endonuclease/exonuclease/phosphatase family protein [Rubritepida sp.]
MRALALTLALLLATPLQAAEVKLATWNIAWLTLRPAGDEALPRGLTPRQPGDFTRLADYARRLEADIVALQEVEGEAAAARVFDPRAYAFFFARENDVQRTGFAIRRGLAATQNEDLAALDLAPGARFSQRRGTDVTVTLNGRPLRLLSVHLNAGCREGPMDAARNRECEGLARQSEVLARWIAERRREGVAFAVLGDFNRRMDHPRDEMTAALAAAAPLTRANEGASNPCWADARGGRPFISHILLGGAARDWLQRGSLRVMVYAERDPAFRDRISDHCPVSVRLRLP